MGSWFLLVKNSFRITYKIVHCFVTLRADFGKKYVKSTVQWILKIFSNAINTTSALTE